MTIRSTGDPRSPSPISVPAGTARAGATTMLFGVSPFNTKVTAADSGGELFVGEVSNVTGFSPPRHLHHDQDEWFHVTNGTFAIEVGGELFEASVGDSLFAPRTVVHAWAPVGPEPSSMLFTLTPAGDFDGFVRDAAELGRLPSPDDANAIFEAHGMQIVGPPLDVATISFTG